MVKRRILIIFFILTLITQLFPLLDEAISQASPEAFEGAGPVLKSRIVTQSSPATFFKKGVILPSYQYASDKIEYPTPGDSVTFGTFGSVTWSNLYWTTRDYQSTIKDGFTLFSNKVFQIRYTPFAGGNYFRINSTYPRILQNFTVPSSYDNFEVKHVWLVVRVYSGSVKLHAEIWNYGVISVGYSTETITVTGPYDWWVTMKMVSPRTLDADLVYKLEVAWETGSSVDVKLLSDLKDADDNAQGNARFFNTTSGNVENMAGMMLVGTLTHPTSNTYSTSFSKWSKALSLRSYRVYLHGRNIPKSSIVMKVNSLNIGTGEVPEIRLTHPLIELAFWTWIQGSISFPGGVMEITSNLMSIEQSRTSYDENHPPPFFRPFASLSIFTDIVGKPWGEWEIVGGAWEAYVEDSYGNLYALPAERVEQKELHLKTTYPLLFYPPALPSYGFLNFTVKFNYTIEVSSPGPEFNLSYSVSPLKYASWNISNPFLSFTAPPYSSVSIKMGPVPRDWVIQKAFVTPGAGGGTPSVSILNDEITVSGILMGASNRYSGRVEIHVKAANYLESEAAYIRFMWMDVHSSVFLVNDTIRIVARAASSIPSFPPGVVSIKAIGPGGVLFSQSLNQLDQNGVTTGNLFLSQAGQYFVSATYISSDSLSVGASEASFNVLRISVSINKKIVPLSSPTVSVELVSSDIPPIISSGFVLKSPNGSTRLVMFDQVDGRFIRELSFPQTDPSAVGNWSIAPSILFPQGISRQLPKVDFLAVDDIPPTVSNITQFPTEVTFMEEVNITCIVEDKGTGVRTVWVSYSSGGVAGNATAKPVGASKYSAIIPRQPPFTTVSYRVYAVDKSGNTSVSETLTYIIGPPLWPLIIIVLIVTLFLIVLITLLYMKRHKPPTHPPLTSGTPPDYDVSGARAVQRYLATLPSLENATGLSKEALNQRIISSVDTPASISDSQFLRLFAR
jgi:hypothetical protein